MARVLPLDLFCANVRTSDATHRPCLQVHSNLLSSWGTAISETYDAIRQFYVIDEMHDESSLLIWDAGLKRAAADPVEGSSQMPLDYYSHSVHGKQDLKVSFWRTECDHFIDYDQRVHCCSLYTVIDRTEHAFCMSAPPNLPEPPRRIT